MDQELKERIEVIQKVLKGGSHPKDDLEGLIETYLVATEDIHPVFIREAVRRLLKGDGRTGNPAFAASPTELALEARRVFRKNLDRTALEDLKRKELEFVVAEKYSPEELERRKLFADQMIASIDFGFPDEPLRRSFSDLPQATAQANLDARLMKRPNPTGASEELQKIMMEK